MTSLRKLSIQAWKCS